MLFSLAACKKSESVVEIDFFVLIVLTSSTEVLVLVTELTGDFDEPDLDPAAEFLALFLSIIRNILRFFFVRRSCFAAGCSNSISSESPRSRFRVLLFCCCSRIGGGPV